MILPGYLRDLPDGVLLFIKLQPRASKSEIGEAAGNELKVRVTAPPVDAAANEALCRFLAEQLDCPRRNVELVKGHQSRHKTLKLHGLNASEVLSRLA